MEEPNSFFHWNPVKAETIAGKTPYGKDNKNVMQPNRVWTAPLFHFSNKRYQKLRFSNNLSHSSSEPAKISTPSRQGKESPLHRGLKYFSAYLHSSPGRPWLKSRVNSPISWLFADMSSWHMAIWRHLDCPKREVLNKLPWLHGFWSSNR